MDLDDACLKTALADVSMETDGPERIVMAQGITLEEKLWVDECYLFQDESLTPIFCKPKLIPLKTITTQKLEQMQREQMEKLQIPEKEEEERPETASDGGDEKREGEPSTSEKKDADVWVADD
uniref:TFIIIC_sub6 domain-containing protein n=1 Tax=Caenorhabditis tropicalis TaxID=1561998 RepID=A0A1I7V468_9PELO